MWIINCQFLSLVRRIQDGTNKIHRLEGGKKGEATATPKGTKRKFFATLWGKRIGKEEDELLKSLIVKLKEKIVKWRTFLIRCFNGRTVLTFRVPYVDGPFLAGSSPFFRLKCRQLFSFDPLRNYIRTKKASLSLYPLSNCLHQKEE